MSEKNNNVTSDDFVAMALVFPVILLDGKIGSDLWGWFIAKSVGIWITPMQMAGITVFAAFLKINGKPPAKQETRMTEQVIMMALLACMMWGFGAIIHAMGA